MSQTIPPPSEPETSPVVQRGVEYAGIIDALSHDPVSDEVTLLMVEPRPWDGSEMRLFQLQEKVNAYLSFALDGELIEAYPGLEGKPLRLLLDCMTAPDSMTLHFLGLVRDQIAFQDIKFEVRAAGPGEELEGSGGGSGGSCGGGCSCHE